MKVPKPEQTEFKKNTLTDGTYGARVYSIVDQGTHLSTFKNEDGTDKMTRELNVSFEIPSELIKYEKDGAEVEFPFAVHKTYTLSLHEKSSLTQLATAAGCNLDDFDTDHLIGKTVLVTIGKTSGGNDKITNVTSLPSGMEVADAVNPTKTFSLDAFDQAVFDALPTWQQEKINASSERSGTTPQTTEDVNPDDIPF
jgi:hypothetical protein